MKLSNKILIGFFGFIFLYMIAAFTEIRFKGDAHRLTDNNSISETTGIVGIKYLVLTDLNQRITVLGSDNPRIEVKSITGDVMQYLKYEINGDTLIVKQLKLKEEQRFTLFIHVPRKDFVGMTTKNTGVTISELEQETLDINQNNGWIRMTGNNKLRKINLKAQNKADFNFSTGQVDTLNTIMNNAEVRISPPVKLVKGSMTNESNLYLRGTGEIQFKKDESSRLVLN